MKLLWMSYNSDSSKWNPFHIPTHEELQRIARLYHMHPGTYKIDLLVKLYIYTLCYETISNRYYPGATKCQLYQHYTVQTEASYIPIVIRQQQTQIQT